MRIASYQTRLVCPSKLANPNREAAAAAMANFVTLEVRTDQDLTGIGYAGFVPLALLKPLQQTLEALAELVVGYDPFRVEAISAKLLEAGGMGAPAGLVTRAAAAIDVALWDLKGKAADQPLFRLLGGASNQVPAYASGFLWRDYDADMLAKTGEQLVAEGFRAMKFRMGAEKSDAIEIERMLALREAVGDEIGLMVDINQGWDVNRSIRVGREMENFELYWLEDPVQHQDYEGLRRIADALDTPVATGEYHYGLAPFAHMLERQCLDIAMVDLLRVGGITHWMKAAHLAEAFNRPVVSHLAPEVLAHCVAAAPNGLTVEHMPWALPLFKERLEMVDGEIVLSERPGLGLEFDPQGAVHLHPDA